MKLKRRTDVLLLHPPSVYDFREKLIIPSPIADLVPSGPFFEMYPVGFSFLGEYLERHGLRVRVVNLATRMLEQPGFDVGRFIERQAPGAFGVKIADHLAAEAAGEIAVGVVSIAHGSTLGVIEMRPLRLSVKFCFSSPCFRLVVTLLT